MKLKFSLTILLFSLNPITSLSQKIRRLIPNEIGINYFTQRTQTIMHYHRITPYYNTWGFNNGIGMNIQYKINTKWSLKIWYNYAKLMNTYDIVKHSPLVFTEDIKKYKPFSYYWISHEVGAGYKYKFYSKKGISFFFEQSICTNYGQLVSDHFPEIVNGDTLSKDFIYQGGVSAKLNYTISQVSVRNMGLNFLNGITVDKKLSLKWRASLNISVNYGFIPLIGTRINYIIVPSVKGKSTVFGEHYALSNNSGIRLGFGMNYTIKNIKN